MLNLYEIAQLPRSIDTLFDIWRLFVTTHTHPIVHQDAVISQYQMGVQLERADYNIADIFKYIVVNENCYFLIQTTMKHIPKYPFSS